MGIKTYVNGKLYPKEEASVSAYDHGFLYGDGVFEGIRIYSGRIFKFEEHIDRFFESLKVTMIDLGMDRQTLMDEIVKVCQVNEHYDRAYIRLVASRGEGDLGINPRKCTHGATLVIITDLLQLYPEEAYKKGLEVIVCQTRKIRHDMLNCRIKSCNYLSNIFGVIEVEYARQLAEAGGGMGPIEGIMLTHDGYVSECTADNVFLIKNGELVTPPEYLGILAGITRQTIMDLATEAGYVVKEDIFTPFDLYTADEVFLCGTGAEMIPVIKIGPYTIGDGTPGPITSKLLNLFRDYANSHGYPIRPDLVEAEAGKKAVTAK
ncbi:MAG TPA: branched-chain-amino-acid transaminase [Firmicutes bacterium]|nr:branched-chain-amino-acid transaminase [Bacillota bacterium]